MEDNCRLTLKCADCTCNHYSAWALKQCPLSSWSLLDKVKIASTQPCRSTPINWSVVSAWHKDRRTCASRALPHAHMHALIQTHILTYFSCYLTQPGSCIATCQIWQIKWEGLVSGTVRPSCYQKTEKQWLGTKGMDMVTVASNGQWEQ